MPSSQALVPELPALRDHLSRTLQWSPVDYVPGIDRAADKQMWAEELTRRLPETDDLRFRSSLAQAGDVAVMAERLPWDSDFFGYGVARLNGVFPLGEGAHNPLELDYLPAIETLLENSRAKRIRYLFAQVDPRDLPLMRALGSAGFSLIETRMHYHFGVQIVHFMRLPDHVPAGWSSFRQASESDIPSLAEVARQAKNPYDRFHGDPFIAPGDVDRLMERWVEESVRGRFADLMIVPDVDQPRAFITYRYQREKWSRWGVHLVQAVLSAVAPEFLGWFAVIGPELASYLSRVGAQYCFGKTQITLGLDPATHFGKGEHIFRIIL
jgi:dTDP-4-amino-4,6-dideoxy-D-galactose acyltransferase